MLFHSLLSDIDIAYRIGKGITISNIKNKTPDFKLCLSLYSIYIILASIVTAKNSYIVIVMASIKITEIANAVKIFLFSLYCKIANEIKDITHITEIITALLKYFFCFFLSSPK